MKTNKNLCAFSIFNDEEDGLFFKKSSEKNNVISQGTLR